MIAEIVNKYYFRNYKCIWLQISATIDFKRRHYIFKPDGASAMRSDSQIEILECKP